MVKITVYTTNKTLTDMVLTKEEAIKLRKELNKELNDKFWRRLPVRRSINE